MRLARLISSFGAGGHFRLVCRSYGANEFVPLTSDRKPHLRRLDFAQLSDGDLKVFEGILGNKRVLTDADDLEGYNTDWMRAYRGNGAVVLRPKTVNEVSEVVRYCNERRLAVVPQGGNTGLVGGSVPVFDEVIISLGLMNNILDINPITGLALCESGVVLEQLDGKLRDHDLVAPLDLGAKGTCQIGGNISTNAGGLRLLRYGSLRNTVLGLEAVLPNGEVMDCLNSLRKDNTGYDLKQLFIGAEGTLGIVTKVALLCPPAPKAVNVAFLGLESYEKVLETFKKTKSYLSEILSACELVGQTPSICRFNFLFHASQMSTIRFPSVSHLFGFSLRPCLPRLSVFGPHISLSESMQAVTREILLPGCTCICFALSNSAILNLSVLNAPSLKSCAPKSSVGFARTTALHCSAGNFGGTSLTVLSRIQRMRL